MPLKVCKFGGTSLADAAQFRKVKALIDTDPGRRYVVPSAPGKRNKEDRKITDLLYLCHAHAQQRVGLDEVFGIVADRYLEIARELGLSIDLRPALEEVKGRIVAVAESGGSADYAASRGEYLSGLLMADLLRCPLIDPAECIHFTQRGTLDGERTQAAISARLAATERAVVPGFYGRAPDGSVKTFSRGGSDITGSIVARGCAADVYENWTDVSGMLMADPRIVQEPRPIGVITYRELRELAYMGATVLHDEAIFPVRQAGIPVNIRNTNRPDDPGTMIVSESAPIAHQGGITGVAGKKGFTSIDIEKALMNQEIGLGRRLLAVLEDHGISFEHLPSGIDTLSVVVEDKAVEGRLDRVVEDIRSSVRPDRITVDPDLSLLAVVGRGMASTPGMAARVFTALARASVNVRMIDQGSSEINIIVGVDDKDFESAMRAIYAEFVPA